MILNVYKEKNWTSFDVVAKIRGILRKKYGKKNVKVGHAGTLDPLAEGVLIVLTDQDTRKQNELMLSEKEYLATIGFGASSQTYDIEMPLEYHYIPPKMDTLKKLKEIIPNYIGSIEQAVPPYSAVKVKGKPLYLSARKGKLESIDIPVKRVFINNIEILNFEIGTKILEATVKVLCGKGVYIRSLAHDLGKDLGIGGVLLDLKRTRVGSYSIEDSIKINDLEKMLL